MSPFNTVKVTVEMFLYVSLHLYYEYQNYALPLSYNNMLITCICVTLPIEPGPINMLTVSPNSSATSLELSWQQSSENNCRETEYEIQYRLINKDQCQMVDEQEAEWLPLPRTTETSIIIQGLLSHTAYNLSVRAVNQAGPGEASFAMQTTNQSGKNYRNTLFIIKINTLSICEPENFHLRSQDSRITDYYARLSNFTGITTL